MSFLEILIVAAVIGLVVLLARRARPFMLGVLGVGAVLVVLLMLGWRFVSVRHHHHEAVRQVEMATRAAESFAKHKKHHKHKEHHYQPSRRKEHLKPPRLVDPMRTPPRQLAASGPTARTYFTPASALTRFWTPIFAILLGAGILFAVITIGVLLANRKTRPYIGSVLGAGAVLLVLVALFSYFLLDNAVTAPLPAVAELPPAPPLEVEIKPTPPLPEATDVIPLNDEGKPPEPDDEASRSAADERPAWVDQPDGIEGGAFHTIVVSDPYTTKRECDAALNEQLLDATQSYLAARLGERAPEEVPVDLAYIRHRVCKNEYTEIMDTSVGPMRRVHVLLEFDEPTARDLMARARAALTRERLFQAGGAAAAVLAALGVAFGYLSLTKGKGS